MITEGGSCTESSSHVAVATALAIGPLSAAVPSILPGLVGILQHGYAFDDAQLGYLSSADLAGMTLGSAIGAKIGARNGVRHGVGCGLVIAALANLSSAAVHRFGPLLFLSSLVGVGAGLVVAGCCVVLGQSKQVARNFSLYLICQLLLGAAALQSLPALAAALGISGVFTIIAALFAVSWLIHPALPGLKLKVIRGQPDDVVAGGAATWMGLAGTLVYFVGQGVVWPYFELIGERGGLDSQVAASGLALSMLIGLLGPGAVALLGTRFGRLGPSVLGVSIQLFSLHLLAASPLVPIRFVCAACVFNIGWNFTVPFQYATLALVDPSGRAIGWAAPIAYGGFSIGSMIAATQVNRTDFTIVLWLSAALFLVSLLGFVPAWSTEAVFGRRT